MRKSGNHARGRPKSARMDWSLQACSSREPPVPVLVQGVSLEEEVNAVKYLEEINPKGLTLDELDVACKYAITPITKILIASLIEQAAGATLEDIFTESGCVYRKGYSYAGGCCESLFKIYSWTGLSELSTHQVEVLSKLCELVDLVYRDHEFPCSEIEGNGYATWAELRVHATSFMQAKQMTLSGMVELLRFIRKRPFLNCTVTVRGGPEEHHTLQAYDAKVERATALFPILHKLADPPFVVIEPIGGIVPPQVLLLLNTLAAATVNPFASGALPARLADPGGGPQGVFENVYRMGTYEEAKAFAGMLRTVLADANNNGGVGPRTRIVVFTTGMNGFRVF